MLGTAPPSNTAFPTPSTIGCSQRSSRSKSFSRRRVWTRSRLPDDLHVLVPVPDLAHGGHQIRAELRGPGPRQVRRAAGGHVLRDAVEERRDPAVLAAVLVRPVGGEDVVGPPAEQQGVGALVRRSHLRSGDVVQQGGLPAAEREAVRILLRSAGRLPDEVEGGEQLEMDQPHVPLPLHRSSWSVGRPAGPDGLIGSTAIGAAPVSEGPPPN